MINIRLVWFVYVTTSSSYPYHLVQAPSPLHYIKTGTKVYSYSYLIKPAFVEMHFAY